MWRENFKPLDAGLWFREIERLAASCAQDRREREDRAVRRAYHLTMIAPMAMRKMLTPALSESEFETMLDQGDSEQAATAILRMCAAVEISHAPTPGRHLAKVTVAGERPLCFEGASPALAMIGAWAQFLMNARNS